MCASCVAQGVTYVGGSVVALRVMAYRAGLRTQRLRRATPAPAPVSAEPPAT